MWMFCTSTEDNCINRLHQRVLRIIYDDRCSTFEELLKKDGAVTIHVRNIRKVSIEMYKVTDLSKVPLHICPFLYIFPIQRVYVQVISISRVIFQTTSKSHTSKDERNILKSMRHIWRHGVT